MYEIDERLYYERNNRRIDYERFIYQNINLIIDYSVIRRALNQIENLKTREGAVRIVRRIIRKYEDENNVIIMETRDKIKKIIEFFYCISLYQGYIMKI